MTLPQIIARNTLQQTNTRALFQQNVSAHPITYYTCPAGKIARISGVWNCLDTGAAAVVDLIGAGVSIAEVQASGGGTDINIPQDLAENLNFPFEIWLEATETLVTAQDSGTNANTIINAKIEEFII